MTDRPVPHPAAQPPRRQPPEKRHNTTKPIAFVVLPFLCVYGLIALGMTYHLTLVVFTAYAHGVKIDPAQVALIAGLSSSGAAAIGIVGGSMIQTEKAPPATNIEQADQVKTGGPTITPAPSAEAPQPEAPIAPE